MSLGLKSARRALMTSVAVACVLGAGATHAQDEDASGTEVIVGPVSVVNSSLDEAAILDLLEGDLAGNAGDLAALNAESIVIKDVLVREGMAEVGYYAIELTNVVDGVAGSASIGAISVSDEEIDSLQLDAISVDNLNIAAILSFYGLADPAEPETFVALYDNFVLAGGRLESEEVSCTINGLRVDSVRGRPLRTDLSAFMDIADDVDPENPDDPAVILPVLRLYADVLTSIESGPTVWDGLACEGEEGVEFAMGPVTIGGFEPGRYPEVMVENFDISVEQPGDQVSFAFDQAVIKTFDLTPQIALIDSIPEDAGPEWLEENYEALIPAFEGFSFAGLRLDVPVPEDDRWRVVGGVGAFDLTLGDFIDGAPSTVQSSIENITLDIPDLPDDPAFGPLRAAGIDQLDATIGMDTSYDADGELLNIAALTLAVRDFGVVALTGQLGNVTEDVFSPDPEIANAAGYKMLVREIGGAVIDQGMLDFIGTMIGGETATGSTGRLILSGLAQGAVLGAIGDTPQTQAIAESIATFIRSGTQINIGIAPIDPDGASIADLSGEDGTFDSDRLDLFEIITEVE